MTFPALVSTNTGTRGKGTGSTSWVCSVSGGDSTLPTRSAGDLLLAVNYKDAGSTGHTTPANWTSIGSQLPSAGIIQVWARVATNDTTDNLTIDRSSNTGTVACIVRSFSGWYGSLAVVADALDFLGGNDGGTTLNPPSNTASWGAADNLWVAMMSYVNNQAIPTAPPSGYTDMDIVRSNGVYGMIASAILTGNATATEDPGAWTGAAANSGHVVIAIRPAGASSSVAPLASAYYRMLNS